MKEITLKAVVQNIQVLTDFINAELEAVGCPIKAQMQIDVALDEVFSNIAHYAYSGDPGEVTIGFSFESQTRIATICFRDRGIPYNSLDKRDPDVTLPAVDRAVGGLGIFLVKKMMDHIAYEYCDGMNVLCISKKV